MNLKELKERVDLCLARSEDLADAPVMITLHEASMGPRAAVGVHSVGIGFDWERDQFRIEPADLICRLGKSYEDAQAIRVTECASKHYYFCPRCHERVRKKDHFCSACGQRVILLEVTG